MANLVAQNYESRVQVFMQRTRDLYLQTREITRSWYSIVSPLVDSASGDDIISLNRLTKDDLINGVTIAGQLSNFFDNQALTKSLYILNVDKILALSGNPTSIDPSVNTLAEQVYNLAAQLKDLYNESILIQAMYWKTSLNLAVAAVPADTTFFGINARAGAIINALTLIENFQKLFDDAVVTQADYFATVVKWNVV